MYKIIADTITGCWETETFDDENCEIMDQEAFLEMLDTLDDGVLIACIADRDFWQKIDNKYGIQPI